MRPEEHHTPPAPPLRLEYQPPGGGNSGPSFFAVCKGMLTFAFAFFFATVCAFSGVEAVLALKDGNIQQGLLLAGLSLGEFGITTIACRSSMAHFRARTPGDGTPGDRPSQPPDPPRLT